MYSDTDLEAAVAAGAISPAAADAFRAHVASTRAVPLADDEQFRLITGFNDIFVTIATLLLLVAVAWIGSSLANKDHGLASPIGGALVAIVSWGLAEFFTLKRRMALPSIVLLIAFVGGIFFMLVSLVISPDAPKDMAALLTGGCALLTAGAAAIHWRRFHVPITIAAGTAALAATLIVSLVGVIRPDGEIAGDIVYTVMFLTGLATFAFAMWWDMSDPVRRTRRSDVAFWLHLLAAPLMVHPAFAMLGLLSGGATSAEALLVLVLYIAMGIVALAIDRRALLVSALAYVLYALNLLFSEFGAVNLNVALTALVIGSALLLLSAFWQIARALIVRQLPAAWQSRLPPIAEPNSRRTPA